MNVLKLIIYYQKRDEGLRNMSGALEQAHAWTFLVMARLGQIRLLSMQGNPLF